MRRPPQGRRPFPTVSRRGLSSTPPRPWRGNTRNPLDVPGTSLQTLDNRTTYGWVVFLSGQRQCYRRLSVPCVVDKPFMAVHDELGCVLENN